MKVTQLYTYPIKSLRGTPLPSAHLSRHGLPYDRHFMLLKVDHDASGQQTLRNMHVPHFPEMCLFTTELDTGIRSEEAGGTDDEGCSGGRVVVTYNPPAPTPTPTSSSSTPNSTTGSTTGMSLEIPLHPHTHALRNLAITMHRSPVVGYDMGEPYNSWFSARLGYAVVLAYIGGERRAVLGSFAPAGTAGDSRDGCYYYWLWLVLVFMGGLLCLGYLAGSMTSPLTLALALVIPSAAAAGINWTRKPSQKKETLTFSDCAPYLLISTTSVANVSTRLPDGEEMDATKFRPNIVVSGAETAFEEDYWGELAISPSGTRIEKSKKERDGLRLILTANCVRCQSLNVDYATGRFGAGEAGAVLKKLMRDRRVDRGARYSPVFGRYGFLESEGDEREICVGDEVVVGRVNAERSVYDWPGLSN
ncbi:MOSC domain protein [Aspergillus sp. HF37]|nr:MOSC domain protein [Aspergillus sp. HF37]